MGFNIKVIGGDKTANAQAAVNSLAIAKPCKLFSVTGFNNGPDQFIQIFDAAAEPAEGTVPLLQATAYANQQFSFSFPTVGRPFTSGVYICNSTTSLTKTKGAANCLIDSTYN